MAQSHQRPVEELFFVEDYPLFTIVWKIFLKLLFTTTFKKYTRAEVQGPPQTRKFWELWFFMYIFKEFLWPPGGIFYDFGWLPLLPAPLSKNTKFWLILKKLAQSQISKVAQLTQRPVYPLFYLAQLVRDLFPPKTRGVFRSSFYLANWAPQAIFRFQSATKGILPYKIGAAGENFPDSECY